MYNAADELGLSQDVRVYGMEAWLKAVEKQLQMWFDLVQRCNKTLLAYQVENKELTKILDEARGMLTTDKDGNLVHLITDMQDVLTAGLGLLVARPKDP
jgi:hypothetical protein